MSMTILDVLFQDPTTGATDDWVKAKGGVKYSFGPELRGPGFILPPEEIQVGYT